MINKLNIALKIINQFENTLNIQLDFNQFKELLITHKLKQLGINNKEFLLKQIKNRIKNTNEIANFYKGLN